MCSARETWVRAMKEKQTLLTELAKSKTERGTRTQPEPKLLHIKKPETQTLSGPTELRSGSKTLQTTIKNDYSPTLMSYFSFQTVSSCRFNKLITAQISDEVLKLLLCVFFIIILSPLSLVAVSGLGIGNRWPAVEYHKWRTTTLQSWVCLRQCDVHSWLQ